MNVRGGSTIRNRLKKSESRGLMIDDSQLCHQRATLFEEGNGKRTGVVNKRLHILALLRDT